MILEEIMTKLHKNSLLKFQDIIRITRRITESIFTDKCSIYKSGYSKNRLNFSFSVLKNNRKQTQSVCLVDYLFQSINPNIPKVNNISYKKLCTTKHCIAVNHFMPYESKHIKNVNKNTKYMKLDPCLTVTFS